MELTSSFFALWLLLLSTLPAISALALPSTALGLAPSPPLSPSSPTPKRCPSPLQNPSFESGLDPWLDMISSSWETRGVYTSAQGGHSGANFYYGHSNSTIDTTLTLSQSGLSIPSGSVECGAWVASLRPGNVGASRVEVFLDGQSCGGPQYLGTTGWTRVGGRVGVSGDGAVHTLAVTVFSDVAAAEGWHVWVDDAWVGC